jgi:hypothetical protein
MNAARADKEIRMTSVARGVRAGNRLVPSPDAHDF